MQRIQDRRSVRILVLAIAMMFAVFTVMANADNAYAAAKPSKVTGVALSSSTATSLKVKWSKTRNAKKYQVAYKKVGAAKFTNTKATSNRYKLVSGLKQDTSYAVKVRAVNGKKYGAWSAVKYYRTKVNYTKAANEAKVIVSVTGDTVTIKIGSLGLSGTGTLYSVRPNAYVKDDNISGLVTKNVTGTKIGAFKMNAAKSYTIDRYTTDGYDRLYDKYYIVQSGKIIKGPIYATAINPVRDTNVEMSVPSKKGLVDEADDTSFEYSEELGSNWTAININFTELILANETASGAAIDNSGKYTDTIVVNNKTYYMNKSYVDFLDSRVKKYEEMGINVVGVVISFVSTEKTSNYPRALKYIDDARWTNGFNTSTDKGRDYFIAGMEYLANRYSQNGNGLICDYVIGNEVDYAYDWNEIIPNKSKNGKKLPDRDSSTRYLRTGEIETRADFDKYMEEYSRALRLANLAVKKYSDDISVGISLSKEWAKSKADQNGYRADKDRRYDSYSPKKMLDWLNYYSKKSGDYDWTLTPHNYPIVSGDTAAYETALTSKKAVISGNPDTSIMITQNNLEVLQLYLNRTCNKYNGKVREIYLTENGSSSHNKGDLTEAEYATAQKEQAASVAQYYYRAASLPSVKAIIYYKIHDREEEGATSFKLGLVDTNGDKKLAYDVWKYIDTNKSFDYADQYLGYISFKKGGKTYSKAKGNINSYRDVMPIVSSSFNWSNYWKISTLNPIAISAAADNTASMTSKEAPEEELPEEVPVLATDKTAYTAAEPVLVTANGAEYDVVSLGKKADGEVSEPMYSYIIGAEYDGVVIEAGQTYDIKSFAVSAAESVEEPVLEAGEYTVILSSDGNEVYRIDITIE